MPIVALWGVVGGEEGKRARDLCYGTAIEDELKRIKKDGHGMVRYSFLFWPTQS